LEFHFMRTLDARRARQALAQLTGEQQEVLILRFGQALSLHETAAIMGKSANTIKQLQFRAVNALRRVLGELGKERPYA
jgi:RNA polymerase sigma-70 factor (ECF subfamily)